MPTSEQSHPVEEKILDLSHHAFHQKGYKGVSMDMIARELKISKKTIYKHFNSKSELLESVLQNHLEEIRQKMENLPGQKADVSLIMDAANIFLEYKELLHRDLREEVAEEIPYLNERLRLFEQEVFIKCFAKTLKNLRNKKVIGYTHPSKKLAASLIDFIDATKNRDPDYRNILLDYLVQGLTCKPGKKK